MYYQPFRTDICITFESPLMRGPFSFPIIGFGGAVAAPSASASAAVFRFLEKMVEKVTSDTVAYCNTFRLFMVNIVLS